jgi:polyhydroxyalkanoate synthase subunit PhaC
MTKKRPSKTKERRLSAAPSVAVLSKAEAPQAASVGAPQQRVAPQRSLPAPPPPCMLDCDDRDPSAAFAETYDRFFHANLARATSGLSPAALMKAYFDWCIHLAMAPGKQMQLVYKAQTKWMRFSNYALRQNFGGGDCCCEMCIEPLPQDNRFAGDEWRRWPFNLISQSFLLTQQWWDNATTGVPGVSAHHERLVQFAGRQLLDMMSPSNCLTTNPKALKRMAETGGASLVEGMRNFASDVERQWRGQKPEEARKFAPGKQVAVTPGEVVYRNRLIELIQYKPTTGTVRPEPILIVPAWIMKYYILDLSPHNSLVKYLVDQGFTVFMISWKNPTEKERDVTFDDYRRLGVVAALDVINEICPGAGVHAAGYCLGGTLLTVAAAYIARKDRKQLKSVTLLAAQVDFEEPGELELFMNESQVKFIEDLMWAQGYLDTRQMAGAFQLLRSKDLIWSHLVQTYLLGEREEMFDLMAWNGDATRLPFAMHSEYLRKLFVNNDLAEGRFRLDDTTIAITDIRAPIFAVGTLNDHVSPWKSVYKIHRLTDTDVTFVLTSGGHNAGIVSEPGRPRRRYQIYTRQDLDYYIDPETWAQTTPKKEGSWWIEWAGWLGERSGEPVEPPHMGAAGKGYPPLGAAPGAYVLQP